jgi:hypothetical protein
MDSIDCADPNGCNSDRPIPVNARIRELDQTRRIPFKFASRIIRWNE